MIHVYHVLHIFWMSNLLSDEIKQALTPANVGKTVYITIGNSLRGDDGVGPYIAAELTDMHQDCILLDAADKPENIVDDAIDHNPTKTVFIDASDFGGNFGDIKVIPEQNIPQTSYSTHMFPIPVISAIITRDTHSKSFFIGIQVKSVGFGANMCDEVLKSADAIIYFIKNGDENA